MAKARILRQMNLIFSVLLCGLAFSPFPSNKALSEELQSQQAPGPLRIVDSNEQSVIIELTARKPHIEAIPQQQQDKIPHNQADMGVASNTTCDTLPPDTEKNYEAQYYHRFTIAGMTTRMKPGEPQIPVYGSLFGISSLDNVSVQILDVEYETLHG